MNFVHILTTIAENVLDDEAKKTLFDAILDGYEDDDNEDFVPSDFLDIDILLDEMVTDRYSLALESEDEDI